MQLASRGDYERHKFSQPEEIKNKVALLKDEPEPKNDPEPQVENLPELEVQFAEAPELKKVPYVKQFPQPPNTPKNIDKVKGIKPWLKQKRIIYGLWAASAAVFIIGGGLTIYGILQNNKIIEQISTGEIAGVSTDGQTPGRFGSEEKPDIDGYMVAPNKPRFITIPKYNIKGRVIEVGVTSTNNMDVPDNVFDAGWYTGSVLPGSGAGASVINGHVSGYTTTGVFYNLKDLNPGDQVSVELGSGKVLNYQVVDKKWVAADAFNVMDVLNPAVAGTEALNLITCGGSFDAGSEQYQERVLVFTKRI